ncbi:MAG: phage head morphogenesis protein [Treponema sp.]
MADKLIPKQALDYIKNKKLRPAFSYKDVWNEEHATAFTVAKSMQLDVLSDIKTAVEKAIENGTTFEQFKKDLKPTLMQKGWWGRKEMTDPLTGEIVNAQLGSDRRLKTIYSTNLRSAYQKGQYDRTMASDAHPYLMYRVGASVHHREQHLKWNNLILPKDDSIWNSIMPPNGYGCKCYTVAVTQARKEKYERNGVPVYNPDTQKTVRLPVQTAAPRMSYTIYENTRKGIIERIPKGITPGFNWNQALPRDKQMEHVLKKKMEAQIENLANGVSEPTKDEMIQKALELIEQKRKEAIPERVYGYSKMKPEEKREAVCNWLIRKGMTSGKERFLITNTAGSVFAIRKGDKRSVPLNSVKEKLLSAKKNSLIFYHNHPLSGSFSFADMRTLNAYESLKEMVAVGHNKTIYSLMTGKRLSDKEFVMIFKDKTEEEGLKELVNKYKWKYSLKKRG